MSDAEHGSAASEPPAGGSWWRTLPGMLTAAAGLISAVTGLVVAVEKAWPTHSAAAPATVASPPFVTTEPSPTSGGVLRVSFPAGRIATANGGLRYEVLSAQTTEANPGRVALALQVKLTNPGTYGANFWNRTFRLRVGADTSAPTNVLDDVVEGGTTKVGEVDFAIPASTRSATLFVGDDGANAVAVPLALASG